MSRPVYPVLFSRLTPAGLALALVSLPTLALESLAPPPRLDAATTVSAPPGAAFTVALPAADSAALTLPVALARAVAANPALQAARHEVDAADGAVLQAGTRPNPSLDLAVEDQRRDSRETTLLVSQPLELGNKRAARVQVAQGEQQAASAALRSRQAALQASVITRFFAVLVAQQHWELAQATTALTERARAATARQVALGKVSPMENTQAQMEAAEVQLQTHQARNDLTRARRQLAATWNAPLAHFPQVDGQLDALPALPDLEHLLDLLPHAPDLMQAQAELGRRQAVVRVEQSQRIPDVTLGLGVKRLAEEGRNRAIVEVSLPLPLFDQNRGNILQALRHSDAARAQLRVTELQLQGELRQSHAELSLALEQADTLGSTILPGAEQGYQAVSRGFERGKFDLDQVLDAQRTLLQARSQQLAALADAHRTHAELMRLVGHYRLLEPEHSP